MPETLPRSAGERLELADYRADFREHFWRIDEVGFWKLERQQHFQEPGDSSWEAFARGDWGESLRLMEDLRPELEAEHRKISEHGFSVRRVRVVEQPLTPYLQWELHLLRVREQSGSGVRVVDPDQVASYETREPLPEVCTLGTAVMYEVVYNELGILDGARRYTDAKLIQRWQEFIADLYSAGEPLGDYFARCVADLPAPTVPPST